MPDTDLDGQWAVVDAFLAASRDRDFERLLAVLDPEGRAPLRRRRRPPGPVVPLVSGIPGGVTWAPDGRPFAVVSVTFAGGRDVSIDVLADPDRLSRLDRGRVRN